METTWTIKVEWQRSDGNGAPIKKRHKELLQENALTSIVQMMDEGHLAGEISSNIRVDDDDPNEGADYTGSFSVAVITVSD